MAEAQILELGALRISVTRKDIKNVHLSVHPPDGAVTMVTPLDVRLDVARAYAVSRLPWIRKQQAQLQSQPRESARQYIDRESLQVWGERVLLAVEEVDAKPEVRLSPKLVTLRVRPGSSLSVRSQVMHAWHKQLLREAIPPLLNEWSAKLDVPVPRVFLQRMKTKWGSCNPATGTIRLNTELVKKPRHLLSYVILHELAHFIEPNHSERFVAVLDEHSPGWESARRELNALPLGA